MEEKLVKTHLIVIDIKNDYSIKWVKAIKETRPMFENGRLVFIVVGGKGRMEVNTNDMTRVEKSARAMSYPKGRAVVTSDVVRILLKQEDESEVLMGLLTHNRVKTFAPMFDKIWV
jgi:2-C-methyl-D-erythritol 4-phosphate cytidylyltransferase